MRMLNYTRETHGKLKASTASTLEEAWKDYRRERICEFVFEGANLYFSMLRWGLANSANSAYNESDGYVNADVIKELETPVSKIYISRDRKKMAVGYITHANQYMRKLPPSTAI
ncbi:MAG: RagB/SusD family nutrient uptake outer membrane protein [Bacteroides sp.]|nr:RagB/SusD family nutrient uptake outer membrane protein [Bacteroides sp.]